MILGGVSFISGCATTPAKVGIKGSPYITTISSASPFHSRHDVYHEVGPSETLWRISKAYGVDMNTIMEMNHLSDSAKLQKGQRLLIPQTLGPKNVIPLYPNPRWTYIVIHHTATDEGNANSIDQLHHKRGFWNGLGYHFLINNGTNGKLDGQIEIGPRWVKQQQGAHANADGMNEKGIGIAVVGNFSERQLTEAELQALVFLVKQLQQYYRIPSANVIGHRDVRGKNTECPGNLFPWNRFKAMLP